jgi:hypothetical protein
MCIGVVPLGFATKSLADLREMRSTGGKSDSDDSVAMQAELIYLVFFGAEQC